MLRLTLHDGETETDLTITDSAVAAFVLEQRQNPAEIERALRIGCEILASTQPALGGMMVERSFERLKRDFDERMEAAVAGIVSVFGDKFQNLAAALDPAAQETPTGALLLALRNELEGMHKLMDPRNAAGPIGQLATDVRRSMEAISAQTLRREGAAEVAAKLTAKGRVFEEAIFSVLTAVTAAHGDCVEATGDTPGIGGSKKGDFVIFAEKDPRRRISVEAKRRRVALSRRFISEELRGGMENRGAMAGLLIVHPEFAAGLGRSIRFISHDLVACVFDPDSNDTVALEVAYECLRYSLNATAGRSSDAVDRRMVAAQVEAIATRVEELSTSERALTITTGDLDKTRAAISATKKQLLGDLRRLVDSLEAGGPAALQDAEMIEFAAPEPLTLPGPLAAVGPATVPAPVEQSAPPTVSEEPKADPPPAEKQATLTF